MLKQISTDIYFYFYLFFFFKIGKITELIYSQNYLKSINGYKS